MLRGKSSPQSRRDQDHAGEDYEQNGSSTTDNHSGISHEHFTILGLRAEPGNKCWFEVTAKRDCAAIQVRFLQACPFATRWQSLKTKISWNYCAVDELA